MTQQGIGSHSRLFSCSLRAGRVSDGQMMQQEKTVCLGLSIVEGTLRVPFLEMPDTFNIPPTGIEITTAHGVACGFCFRQHSFTQWVDSFFKGAKRRDACSR